MDRRNLLAVLLLIAVVIGSLFVRQINIGGIRYYPEATPVCPPCDYVRTDLELGQEMQFYLNKLRERGYSVTIEDGEIKIEEWDIDG